MHRACHLFLCLITAIAGYTQEPAYRQFTVKDGLPGSIVYHCIQDRKGFIWFATNQGVTRFDGRTFHTYTKKDGLPDNDILQLYLDRFDNVWFISWIGIPSVMHDDSIIRFDNCPAVAAILEDRQTDSIYLIADMLNPRNSGYYRSPDSSGRWKFTGDLYPREQYAQRTIPRVSTPNKTNFYFSSSKVTNGSNLLVENSHAKRRFHFQTFWNLDDPPFTKQLFLNLLPDSNSIVFLTYDSAYYASTSQLSPLFSLHTLGLNSTLNSYVNCVYCENDSTLWLCARNQGLLRLRNFKSGHYTVSRFFPGSACTSIMKDHEGGYWVTTFSDGVFYIPNLCFNTFSGPPDLSVSSVRSLHLLDSDHLVAGYDDGNIMEFDKNTNHYRLFPNWAAHNKNNRIMDVQPYGRHNLLVATDIGLHRLSPNDTHTLLVTSAFKELFIKPDHNIVVDCSNGIMFLDTSASVILNQIGSERVTCLAGLGNNGIYWGGFHGVNSRLDGHITRLGQSIPALAGVITHIDIAPDTALWVSTEDGIVIWKNGSVHRIATAQDLASDLCKQVSFDGNTAWVATNKGISRIDYHWQDTTLRYTISNITSEDGLSADDVNRMVLTDGYVWAATARGICYFPETYTGRSATIPGIVLTRILVDDRPLDVCDSPVINYESGKLLIEMAGISYRSGHHVDYEYRLRGADSSWNRLAGNTLEFPTLPYGRFTLELRSIDRWSSRSRPIGIPIIHPYPFYRSPTFLLITYIIIVMLTGAGFYLYFRRRQHKKETELQLRKKMHDLELSALRAQMNPHFIFNCLTSIQYHVLNADTLNANSYLHKFSNLIRLTLNQSSSSFISLYDEIKMLNLYLELEKLRLGHRMNYRIISPQPAEIEGLCIPPMIIQPYVENAVLHGISPLEHRTGELSVEFRLSAHYLQCTIEDNGEGIDHGRTRRQSQEHVSLGTGITARRIRTLNSIYKQQIILDIVDKRSAGLDCPGTIVTLSFPINID